MQVSPSLSHFFSRQQQLYTDLTRYVPTQYRYTRWQHIYLTYLGTLSRTHPGTYSGRDTIIPKRIHSSRYT